MADPGEELAKSKVVACHSCNCDGSAKIAASESVTFWFLNPAPSL